MSLKKMQAVEKIENPQGIRFRQRPSSQISQQAI